MSWPRQVWHVLAHDIRRARWMLLAYVAAVVIAAFELATWSGALGAAHDISMIAIVVLSVALITYAVQSDSPVDPTAFWVVRPLSPTAVLTAKLALGLGVVALPAAGEFVALRALRAPPPVAVHLLTSGLANFGYWLLACTIAAAFTRNLRTFVAAAIGIPVAVALTLLATVNKTANTTPRTWTPLGADLFTTGVIAAALLLLYLVYTRRDLRFWIYLPAAFVGLATLALTGLNVASPRAATPEFSAAPLSIARPPKYAGQTQSLTLQFSLADSISPDIQVTLDMDSAVARYANGASAPFDVKGRFVSVQRGLPATATASRMYRCNGMWFSFNGPALQSLSFTRRQIQLQTAAGGLASVEVYGREREDRAVDVGALGETGVPYVTAGGVRAALTGYTHDDNGIGVDAALLTLGAGASSFSTYYGGVMDGPYFVELVNAERGSVVPLFQRGSRGGEEWLVMPGSTVQDAGMQFRCDWPADASADSLPDPSWYRSAVPHLVRWQPLGAQPVHATFTSTSPN